MTPGLPQIVDGLEIHETDEGLIVYQESDDRVHHLNHTAAVILDLCDGTRPVEEIAAEVGQIFGLTESPSAETQQCIEHLERENLIH